MKRYYPILLALVAAVAFSSCHKDDDDSSVNAKYVSGTLSFQLPLYVRYGDEYTLTPAGAHYPGQIPDSEGNYRDTLGYCFSNPLTGNRDTTKLFGYPAEYGPGFSSRDYLFRISRDTLATFSISANAFAPGYYSISCSRTFTIVSDEGTLVGFPSYPEDGTVTIEGKTYPTATVGGKQWMRRNLASETAGHSFESSPAMDNIFGRYYTWEEAQTLCPEGWELPSLQDWQDIYASFGNRISPMLADVGFNSASKRMWETWYQVGLITDESHLSILPCGYGMKTDGQYKYKDAFHRAAFWTSDGSARSAVFAEIYQNRNAIGTGSIDGRDVLFQVRCKRK